MEMVGVFRAHSTSQVSQGFLGSDTNFVDFEGENVSESGVGDTSVLEAVEITETHSSTVEGEENGSCKIEGEVREERGYGVVSSSSVGEDAIQVENVNVEVKVDIVNDLLPHKKPGNVSPKVSSKGVENQAMEINDEQAKKSKCQNKDATTFDERVLQENENLEANDLNLLVDLEPYMGANGNAEMDSKEAELNVGDLVWGKVRSHPWWLRVFCSNHHTTNDGEWSLFIFIYRVKNLITE
uniref:PWWP domain-containing protein n=1 Tax=Salix viminalis TaxID=40686 RepID=A0A6N2N804_SALVM